MGKKKNGQGWRSMVKEGDTLGDHFADVSGADAAQEIVIEELTARQIKQLQDRHFRQAGAQAAKRMNDKIGKARGKAGHGDDDRKIAREISCLERGIVKQTKYLDPEKLDGACPESVARRRAELAEMQARLAALKAPPVEMPGPAA